MLPPYPYQAPVLREGNRIAELWDRWINKLRELVNGQNDRLTALEARVDALETRVTALEGS